MFVNEQDVRHVSLHAAVAILLNHVLTQAYIFQAMTKLLSKPIKLN